MKQRQQSLSNNVKPNIVFLVQDMYINAKDPLPFTEKDGVIYGSVWATENCDKECWQM